MYVDTDLESTTSKLYDLHKKKRRAALWQCLISTVPLFGILLWLLIKVAIGESHGLDEEQNNDGEYDKKGQVNVFLDLQELIYAFVVILYISSSLLVYVGYFIPKRKALFKKYNDVGILAFGDVTESVANRNREKIKNPSEKCTVGDYLRYYYNILRCRYGRRDVYFESQYVITDEVALKLQQASKSKKPVVPGTYKKVIRTVFPWHREKIAFLLLPNQPKSGLPKADIELDISNHGNHYSKGLKYVATFWVLFSLFGATFTVSNFKDYYNYENGDDEDLYGDDDSENVVQQLLDEEHVWRNYWIGVCLCGPIVLAFNFVRFALYYKFLVKSGTVQGDEEQKNKNDLVGATVNINDGSDEFRESDYVAIT